MICHLLDVGAVAEALWDGALTPQVRRALTGGLGLEAGEHAARCWVAFLAAIHDLGKASPVFQLQKPDCVNLLRSRGLEIATKTLASRDRLPHGVITAWALQPWLKERGVPRSAAQRLAIVVGGHHGLFPPISQQRRPFEERVQIGGPAWDAARASLADEVARLLGLDGLPPPRALSNATALLLAGFVSVADWIGSDENCFGYRATFGTLGDEPVELDADLADARRQAASVVSRLGWDPPPWDQARPEFRALFGFQPSPMQAQVLAQGQTLSAGPALMIVEAPTGEGKTEAALALLDEFGSVQGLRGGYFALPTQATSNSLYRRTRGFLQRRFPGDRVQLQLLHGHAALSAEFQATVYEPRIEGVFDHDLIQDEGQVVASTWFTARKRGLLAPWGVGTVDQGLLAALEAKHVFVRLFGLAHKMVVIDEVHAYDAYMSTLLGRLLEWLGALGTSVVLLSATLPRERRAMLARAYAAGANWPEPSIEHEAAYPCLTWASGEGAGALALPTSPWATKDLAIRWAAPADDDDALADALERALADGGCAAVICNTVARAQRTYRALRVRFPGLADDGAPQLDLLHARFLIEERERRERRVQRRFGKPGGAAEGDDGAGCVVRRPNRAVLVATQVIEQSLDLDFDLLVSDMAPGDLLLQRAGRLHRHERPNRPSRLETPTLWLRQPMLEDGVPIFDGGTLAVYAEHVLLRTWLRLAGEDKLTVPDKVASIVEAVYGEDAAPPSPPAWRAAWDRTAQHLAEARATESREAERRWLRAPRNRGELAEFTRTPREEDSPDLHTEFQALTRLAEESLTVILLNESSPAQVRRLADAKRLLRRSVNLSHKQVVWWLKGRPRVEPASWSRSPLLRYAYLVRLDAAGCAAVGDRSRLRLDPELGLVIESAEESDLRRNVILEGGDSGRFLSP